MGNAPCGTLLQPKTGVKGFSGLRSPFYYAKRRELPEPLTAFEFGWRALWNGSSGPVLRFAVPNV